MSDLPTGTVTFLFTDIEGSTRLLQHLGERWKAVVETHQQLLRAAFRGSLVGERHTALRAKVLHNLALLASGRGDVDGGWRLNEEALRYRRIAGDTRGEAETLGNLGALAQLRGDLAEARRLYQESLTLRRRLGDRHGIALILNNLAELAEMEGDLAMAVVLFVHAERLFHDLRPVHVSIPAGALQRLADLLGTERWTELRVVAEGTRLEEIVARE
jgi:tetratricopeptide (TPR) repeat protein